MIEKIYAQIYKIVEHGTFVGLYKMFPLMHYY